MNPTDRMNFPINRRKFLLFSAATAASQSFLSASEQLTVPKNQFSLNYMLASCMYGELDLKVVLDAATATGAKWVDLWPRKHGNQREQLDEWGSSAFSAALKERDLKLGCLTRYDLGPFKLTEEIRVAQSFNCPLIVCGGKGPVGLSGSELKSAVRDFVELLKPHCEAAAEAGVSISIENHANNLIHTPDSILWLKEFAPCHGLGFALAPYHLETLGLAEAELSRLILDLGNFNRLFYAWQYGMGCMTKLPKEQELLQMPGRGGLDFKPLLNALKTIEFDGFTEVFMHPVPRGIPILPTAQETTEEILKSKSYLERFLSNEP